MALRNIQPDLQTCEEIQMITFDVRDSLISLFVAIVSVISLSLDKKNKAPIRGADEGL